MVFQNFYRFNKYLRIFTMYRQRKRFSILAEFSLYAGWSDIEAKEWRFVVKRHTPNSSLTLQQPFKSYTCCQGSQLASRFNRLLINAETTKSKIATLVDA